MGGLIVLGPITINSNSGVIVTGSTFNASPISTSKSVFGSGASNTGYYIQTNTGISGTNAVDPDLTDSNISKGF
jgi:spore germination protein PF